MKKELENTLQKVLEKSIEVAQQTEEFVIEQSTDILQQFFMWHTTKHILGIVLGIALCTLSYFITKSLGNPEKPHNSYLDHFKFLNRWYDEIVGMFIIIFVFISLISAGIMTMIVHIYKLVYITIAPKLYLIEYFLN